MTKWRCKACTYVWEGDAPPKECPKCETNGVDFYQLDESVAKKIERARHSNMLHQDLVRLCREVEAVCKDGIEDSLDPGCVDVFQKCLDNSYEMMKLSMAEQAVHVHKEKWG